MAKIYDGSRTRKFTSEHLEISRYDLAQRLDMAGEVVRIEQCVVYANGNELSGWRIITAKEIK